MTSDENPFTVLMAQAQDMAKAFNPALESFSTKDLEKLWPTMPREIMEMSFGKGLGQDGLDAKTRLLLTLAGLTMQGAQSESQLRMTVRHLIEAGANKTEVAQTIAHMSVFAGLPAMNRAMDLAQDVLNETQDTAQEDAR